MKPPWVDLTQSLSPQTPVYPGDPGVELEILDVACEPTDDAGRSMNNSRLRIGLHNGTHVDAPFHFFSDRATIDQVELADCCGPALVLDLSQTQRPGWIDAADLAKFAGPMATQRIPLLFTGWDRQWKQPNYFDAHPVLTRAAARTLVEWKVKAVGVDFPSVDRDPFEAHLELLGNDVLIVENLTRLDQLLGEEFDFFAAPLPILGRDASPVRAFARRPA